MTELGTNVPDSRLFSISAVAGEYHVSGGDCARLGFWEAEEAVRALEVPSVLEMVVYT